MAALEATEKTMLELEEFDLTGQWGLRNPSQNPLTPTWFFSQPFQTRAGLSGCGFDSAVSTATATPVDDSKDERSTCASHQGFLEPVPGGS
jgi:hypothetical protein